MDKIIIKELLVQALIGVYDFERDAKQPLLVDVELCTDLSLAAASDCVEDTIDYAALAGLIRERAEATEYLLLERLAQDCIDSIFQRFPATAVTITISKPNIVPDCQQVAVQLSRQRQDG